MSIPDSAPVRLAGFGVAVVVAFGLAFGVGATIGPDLSDVEPMPMTAPMGEMEGMDHDGS
jgi:hypothetical protein